MKNIFSLLVLILLSFTVFSSTPLEAITDGVQIVQTVVDSTDVSETFSNYTSELDSAAGTFVQELNQSIDKYLPPIMQKLGYAANQTVEFSKWLWNLWCWYIRLTALIPLLIGIGLIYLAYKISKYIINSGNSDESNLIKIAYEDLDNGNPIYIFMWFPPIVLSICGLVLITTTNFIAIVLPQIVIIEKLVNVFINSNFLF